MCRFASLQRTKVYSSMDICVISASIRSGCDPHLPFRELSNVNSGRNGGVLDIVHVRFFPFPFVLYQRMPWCHRGNEEKMTSRAVEHDVQQRAGTGEGCDTS